MPFRPKFETEVRSFCLVKSRKSTDIYATRRIFLLHPSLLLLLFLAFCCCCIFPAAIEISSNQQHTTRETGKHPVEGRSCAREPSRLPMPPRLASRVRLTSNIPLALAAYSSSGHRALAFLRGAAAFREERTRWSASSAAKIPNSTRRVPLQFLSPPSFRQ